ncbi:MAG: T9SS type A sorting domain-containing protein [Bacteroidetes bacterium]|nr:T9SS type A sorting domain-containing protein [Bacteroidota bacterium]
MNSILLRTKNVMMALIAVGGFTLDTFSQIQIGQDIDGEAADDESGRSVSMPDAYTVAIGAIGNDGGATNAGHVRIYTWNGTSWAQKGPDIDGEAAIDESGFSVSMPDANTVAIGSRYNDGNGIESGQVRIYAWNGTTWIQKGMDINGEAASDQSGISISMPDANTVAIGASANDGNGSLSGHTRIYSWNGTAWVQKGIDIDGEAAQDNSGTSVSMPDANTVAIGASQNDGSASAAGHTRIYEWNGAAWVQKGIDIDGEAATDYSGFKVCMPDANTVAIAAIYNDGTGTDAGHVRIYSWDGTAWAQKGIDIDGEAANDQSGESVSMPDANTVAIGAPGNDGNGLFAGHVRIYSWNGTSWVQKGIDIDSEAAGDESGISVSMPDANTIAVAANLNDDNGIDAGQVRVYRLNGVKGLVYNDMNQNCILDELGVVEGIMGIIQPGNIVVETGSSGTWFLDSLPVGSYTVTYDTTGNWVATCPNPMSFTVTDPNNLNQIPDFGMLNSNPCPEPTVSIHMPFMRPGFSNQYVYVSACNTITGTGALNTASVVVSLDTLITLDAASISYTSLGNNTFSFDIGNLDPGECVNFNISTTLSNSAILGRTLCMEAELFPLDSCVLDSTPAPAPSDFILCSLPWDKSSISVQGECVNDSIIFTITNTGDPGDGDMDCFSPVRLYIDGAYIWLDSLQLNGGESFTYSFAGDGQTWHLEVDQHPLHPGNSNPNATIERCGNPDNWTPDLVNIFPHDDLDPINDIYCGVVTGSYDPNDKTGFPLGVGNDHLIAANGKMDYVIRFQNTGTDTAFTVVIRDTLDLDLDIFSVQSGVASHDYSFQMYGPRVLEWTFNNILLPDSNVNEPASNGFLTFTVNQVPGLADGTEITNTGNIYFDFNPPIITNTTSHIIGSEIGMPSWTEEYAISGNSCDEYVYNGLSYVQSGSYYQLIEGMPTDTLVTLNLTINNSTDGTDTQIACESYLWIDGNTYTTSNNTATHTLTTSEGCDSVVTLNLTINNPTAGIDVQTACESYLWIDGNTYTTSNNTATHTLTSVTGCDSVVTLNLTINNSTAGTDVQTACNSYLWIDGNTYTTSNNTATHILTNAAGCDSVVTLNLTINNISDITTTLTDITVTANNSTASYVWLDCDNNFAPISGETGQSFTPAENGNYAVALSENGCLDTSACVAVTTIGIVENSMTENFIIFPNPTDGVVKIVFENDQEELNVSLFSIEGKLLESKTFTNSAAITFEIEGSSGVYLLKLNSNNQEAIIRVVKE